MTQEQLDVILAETKIEDQIKLLSVSSFVIPKWSDLKVQYNPEEHAIIKDTTRYPVILNASKGGDDMKRITRALQRLASNRMAQVMFATAVERIYNYDKDIDSQQTAVDIIEEIYRTQNYIDAENIERAKQVNASCQVATVWSVYEEINKIKDQESKYKLAHTSYCEMDGYKIFANVDNNKNLIVISFSYTDSSDVEFFDIYIGGLNPQFISYQKGANWALTVLPKNPMPLEVFPVVYTYLKQPVWGGDSGTTQVETIEETVSYRAMYIKKNAVPLATMDMGKTENMTKSTLAESQEDQSRIVRVGEGGKIEYVVWDVNNGTSEQQIRDMESGFFEDNQIPNNSFATMLKSNMSAENRELVFQDSKAKAIDLGGEWQKLFNDELNKIIIPNCKIMFPGLAADFDLISVRSKIKPFSIKNDTENAEIVANAGGAMSLSTKVNTLNLVDDKNAEVKRIEDENATNANQGLL